MRYPSQIAWNERNRERRIATTKAWFARNPGYKKQWRAEHPESDRAYAASHPRDRREYDALHRDEKALRTRRWAQEHPERRQVNEARRRAQKRGTGGNGVTHEQWAQLREEYGHRCAYCAELRPLVMDHIEPLSKGGIHDVSNVAPACQPCNSSKHNRTILVWLARQAHRGIRQ